MFKRSTVHYGRAPEPVTPYRRRCTQRLRPGQRSIRQAREDADRGRCLERHSRITRQFPGGLDRAPLRQRSASCHRTLDGHSYDCCGGSTRCRSTAEKSARHLRQRDQLVEGTRAVMMSTRDAEIPAQPASGYHNLSLCAGWLRHVQAAADQLR